MPKQKCKFCGYSWNSKKQQPKQCPLCKRYLIKKPNKKKRIFLLFFSFFLLFLFIQSVSSLSSLDFRVVNCDDGLLKIRVDVVCCEKVEVDFIVKATKYEIDNGGRLYIPENAIEEEVGGNWSKTFTQGKEVITSLPSGGTSSFWYPGTTEFLSHSRLSEGEYRIRLASNNAYVSDAEELAICNYSKSTIECQENSDCKLGEFCHQDNKCYSFTPCFFPDSNICTAVGGIGQVGSVGPEMDCSSNKDTNCYINCVRGCVKVDGIKKTEINNEKEFLGWLSVGQEIEMDNKKIKLLALSPDIPLSEGMATASLSVDGQERIIPKYENATIKNISFTLFGSVNSRFPLWGYSVKMGNFHIKSLDNSVKSTTPIIKEEISAIVGGEADKKTFSAEKEDWKRFLWLFLIIPLILILIVTKNRISIKKPKKSEEAKEERAGKVSADITEAISVNNFTVEHGGKGILDNVSFTIKRGGFVSIVGGTGSGKSTIIEALVGRRKQTSGRVRIFEKEVGKDDRIYQYVGFVPQSPELYANQTVLQNLEDSAIKWGIEDAKERIKEILNKLGIAAIKDLKARNLSGGQSRLLSLAMELIREPDLLILDEPTTGLDPNTRNQIITILSSLARYEHKTILITTHFMDDAEECDEVIIIGNKKILAQGAPERLEGRLPGGGRIVNIVLDNVTDDLLNRISKIKDIENIIREGRALNILTNNPDPIEIANKIREVGGSVIESKRTKATMKEVFVFFTGKPAEEG